MNKLKYAVAVAFFFQQAVIFAALPPLFEDIAEIKAILDEKRLSQLLESGESIKEIQKIEKGYVIKTNQHKVFVKVIYKPNVMPGPAQFDIEFATPQHLDD